MAFLKLNRLVNFMIKKNNYFFDGFVNLKNSLYKNNLLYIIWVVSLLLNSIFSLVNGLFPQIFSYERIFNQNDGVKFPFILWIISLSVYLAGILCFAIISLHSNVFNKKRYVFYIIGTYFLILILLDINALFFTNFEITTNGWNIIYNPIMIILDNVFILPFYIFIDWNMLKHVRMKIVKLMNNIKK